MTEKKAENGSIDPSQIVVFILLVVILGGVVIAISIVYKAHSNSGASLNQTSTNVSNDYITNECTQSASHVEVIASLQNQDPFPFMLFSYMYRPTVVTKQLTLMFAFGHDNSSWSLDKISFIDTTTSADVMKDGDFESNYLTLNYLQCILSNTRSSVTDILFDNPYSNDFYYNDQTNTGMTYLSQVVPVAGGRYYNVSFYLENRGYPNNTFILLVGY